MVATVDAKCVLYGKLIKVIMCRIICLPFAGIYASQFIQFLHECWLFGWLTVVLFTVAPIAVTNAVVVASCTGLCWPAFLNGFH